MSKSLRWVQEQPRSSPKRQLISLKHKRWLLMLIGGIGGIFSVLQMKLPLQYFNDCMAGTKFLEEALKCSSFLNNTVWLFGFKMQSQLNLRSGNWQEEELTTDDHSIRKRPSRRCKELMLLDGTNSKTPESYMNCYFSLFNAKHIKQNILPAVLDILGLGWLVWVCVLAGFLLQKNNFVFIMIVMSWNNWENGVCFESYSNINKLKF